MLDNFQQMPGDSPRHIEVFAERYNQLLMAARSLTNNNREHAIDLVHDALIEFVRHSPDLHKINNLDGYLRTLMSNLFKSQKKRLNIRLEHEVTLENYDSVERKLPEIADRYCNPHILLQTQDVLRLICEYACFRREKLKCGSALILRFFHGYHTSEIAEIIRVTSGAVSHQLKLARTEVCLFLNNPKHLGFSREISNIRGNSGLKYGCLVDDLLSELRNAIFRPPSLDKCVLQFRLHKLYGRSHKQEIDCQTLAHIVSCADCLDAVNDFLGLELLSLRYPTDMLSRYTKNYKISRPRITRQDEMVSRQSITSSIQVSCGD